MLLGTDELTILRGSKFYGTWQWINSVTGEPENFAGLTASIKIKNIHEEFAGIKNTFEVGTAIVEPPDVDSNPFKGRVDISLSKEDTLYFAIPSGEDDRYGESDFYAVLEILLSTGEVILQAKVRVIESLESETLNYLIDERSEAIIINGKLDNILLRNNEYISTRDNLIDVVIPTALSTYNDNHTEKLNIYNNNDSNKTNSYNTNHTEKLNIYNDNHTSKLDTYNSNDISKTNTYNQNHATKLQEVNTLASNVQTNKDLVDQAKANVFTMKDEVQGNKDSVALMKTAIETMLDNFDDKFLGLKDTNPTLDNDGNTLVIGAIYYNNISKELRFYNGVSWDSPVAAAQTYALQASQYASNALASKNAAKTSEDNAKLSEQNAQAIMNSYTANDVLTKVKSVDGSGSGLDADLLDGLESSEFMKKSANNIITQHIIFNNDTTDSNGFSFISNTGATPPQDIHVDIYNGVLRWFRNSGLQPFSIGTDNNLYADNGINGNGRILTTTTPLGYSTSALGVGGTAVQDTSKSTTITLNKLTGLIATANSALAAGASATFTLNNNQIGANDGFYITPWYGYIDPYNYKIETINTFNGGARIKITNISTGSLNDIVQFKFQVLKGVIS